MASVTLAVAGHSYDVVCRDGEEDRLCALAQAVDARAADVARAVGRGNEARVLLLTALLLADDLDEARAGADTMERAADAIERTAERLEAIATRLAWTPAAS